MNKIRTSNRMTVKTGLKAGSFPLNHNATQLAAAHRS